MSDEQCQPLLLTSVIASGNGGDGSGGEFPSRLVVSDQGLRHRRCRCVWLRVHADQAMERAKSEKLHHDHAWMECHRAKDGCASDRRNDEQSRDWSPMQK